ncbi:hypothetical protein D3C80_1518000 [compost metagenome]
MRQAQLAGQLAYVELRFMLPDVVGDVFTLNLAMGLLGQQVEGAGTQDLGIQPIRIAGLPAVAAVVIAASQVKVDELVDELGIRQRAVTGQPDDMGGCKGLGRQVETCQHIVQGAAKTGNTESLTKQGDGLIIGLIAGGDHQLIQQCRAFEPLNLTCEHGFAQQEFEHLARQPTGACPGLQDSEDHDDLHMAGLMRAGSSQARLASSVSDH